MQEAMAPMRKEIETCKHVAKRLAAAKHRPVPPPPSSITPVTQPVSGLTANNSSADSLPELSPELMALADKWQREEEEAEAALEPQPQPVQTLVLQPPLTVGAPGEDAAATEAPRKRKTESS